MGVGLGVAMAGGEWRGGSRQASEGLMAPCELQEEIDLGVFLVGPEKGVVGSG